MDRPILAIDIDGVISLFGFDEPPPAGVARFELIDGVVHCISLPAGERLLRLGPFFDMVWATGWEEKANDYMPNVLAMPELPVLTFKGATRFGSAHWKLFPIDECGRGRPLAWIDDSFDDSCYEWAHKRREPTLLVPTESALGLEEAHTDALIAWARGLGGRNPVSATDCV
jgi:hypothetical protein